MQIPESLIEQLNAEADLVEIIGKHTTLKPAGREFKGCCPFHGEKTPSFYVNPQTNLYYCFGCHAKGNAITFLKEFERMNFIESVKYLSEQTGIELPKDTADQQKFKYKKTIKTQGAKPIAPQPDLQPQHSELIADDTKPAYFDQSHHLGFYDHDAGVIDQTDDYFDATFDPSAKTQPESQGDLYSLLEQVHRYYQFMLHSIPFAKQYFLDRGLSDETIETFGLGYAPEGWQHLEQVFPHDIEGLKILGLVRDSTKAAGRSFDLLRHRVIFPIKDTQGRIVGFAGRSLGDEMPKYINSSESPVFQKQHILYGLYEARQQKARDYLMVEGYMDVIALYQAGIYGAVAPMGTAANEKQIDRLLRYNHKLTLCFDGDSAGQKAAWRTLEIAAPVLHDGRELRFLTLVDGHDPDTYIKAHGIDAMQTAIDGAVSLSDYLYGVLSSQFDLTRPEQKAQAMATLRALTELLPKGSSLRWWLNSDIYQKLKAIGKDGRFTARVDTINYNSTNDIDAITEIALSIVHTPSLLTPDPLAYIINSSQMQSAHEPLLAHMQHQDLALPDLPTWASFDSPLLNEVITIIKQLPEDVLSDDISPYARAHFISAALSHDTRQQIQQHWQHFQSKSQHPIADQLPMFLELLSVALKEVLSKQQIASKNLLLSEIYKRRLQALINWDNAHNKAKLAEMLVH